MPAGKRNNIDYCVTSQKLGETEASTVDEQRFAETLKRMLTTPPTPHDSPKPADKKKKPAPKGGPRNLSIRSAR